MRIILITGISGSGKSVALNVLEDAGYYCVDNLPAQFIPELTRYLASQGYTHLGVATDIRSRESLDELPDTVRALAPEHQVEVVFLTASTDALVQRYSETRRRHPLSIRTEGTPGPGGEPALNDTALMEAIEMERELLSPLAEAAHRIDTSNVRTNTLRSWIKELIRDDS
ncbi:MAG: RNase adapter RapZ, partial [Solimonas sp.]